MKKIIFLFLIFSVFSCKGKSSSQEQLVSDYLQALSTPNANMAYFFPSKEAFLEIFKCESFDDIIEKNNSYIQESIATQKDLNLRKAKVKFLKITEHKKEEKIVQGTQSEQCRVLKDFKLEKLRIDYQIEIDGKKQIDDSDLKLIQINGKWYLRKPFTP